MAYSIVSQAVGATDTPPTGIYKKGNDVGANSNLYAVSSTRMFKGYIYASGSVNNVDWKIEDINLAITSFTFIQGDTTETQVWKIPVILNSGDTLQTLGSNYNWYLFGVEFDTTSAKNYF